MYRLPEDGGVLPKHVEVNREFHCCKYLDVSRLINEKQKLNLNLKCVHGAVDGFMHKEK
jgi:hypothetical protein